MKDNLKAAIAKKRKAKVLSMLRRGYPQEYIASYLGMSKGRVSQIIAEDKAQQKIL
jgi:transcriptional regulator